MNCKNGHSDSERYSTPRGLSRCRLCDQEKSRRWKKQNKEKVMKITAERGLRKENAADAAAAKLKRTYELQALIEAGKV